MSKAGVVGSVALAALELIPTGSALAQAKFSGSVALGWYHPSAGGISEGLPFGVGLRGDYGNQRAGFWGSASWFGKTQRSSDEYKLRGPGDMERDGSNLLRIGAGVRIGSPLRNVSLGGIMGENDKYFVVGDRKFSSYELERNHDFSSFYGLTGGFTVGGKINDDDSYGLFFRGEGDYMLHQLFDEPVWGINLSAGVNFTAP
jgi:hypothetical protein|tara:strand:- start:36 stop:641 length:606 start_codon:yes stop_codon:yes gene_type:complete